MNSSFLEGFPGAKKFRNPSLDEFSIFEEGITLLREWWVAKGTLSQMTKNLPTQGYQQK